MAPGLHIEEVVGISVPVYPPLVRANYWMVRSNKQAQGTPTGNTTRHGGTFVGEIRDKAKAENCQNRSLTLIGTIKGS